MATHRQPPCCFPRSLPHRFSLPLRQPGIEPKREGAAEVDQPAPRGIKDDRVEPRVDLKTPVGELAPEGARGVLNPMVGIVGRVNPRCPESRPPQRLSVRT